MFQPLEDESGVAQDGTNAAVEEDRGTVAGGGIRRRIAVVFLSLLLYRTFQGDWERDGYPCELERELGPPAEVKVGKFTKGVLDLEKM